MEPTKAAIAWRLYAALASDTFRQMFSARHNSVNFDQLIAERKAVVVKGGFDSLGEEGMRIFLQFLVAQYYAAGMRRLKLSERDRHLNLFICDEASHILTTPVVARMLFDLRKVSCGFLGATQVWEQVATEVKAAVLGNTAIKIVGPVQHNDASVLSREMYCDIDFIRNMQRNDSDPNAPWAMYVSGMTKKAARVTVPFGVLEKMPRINQNAISLTPTAAISTKTSEEELEDILKYYQTMNEKADAMLAENQRMLVRLKEIERQQTQEGSGEPSHTEMPKQRGDTEASPSQPVVATTGADQTSETIPQQAEKATKRELSDEELVIFAARPIETMLVQHLGATGRGLHEKVQSVKDKLPSYLIRPAFHVAEMRNGVLHEEGFVLRDRAKFIQCAKSVEDYLRQTYEGVNKSESSSEKSTQPAEYGKRRTSRENLKPEDKELPDSRHTKGATAPETVKPGKDWD
jgi:hypothetical protein